MRTVLVTGFLGSGKTTFLLQIIRYLTAQQKTFAVIVNEIGEVGIDNQMLKQVGANVWEVLGGCICCTSATGLVGALDEAVHNYHPDYVLVEPSGIADPAKIKAVFESRDTTSDETLKAIALVDSDRIQLLIKAVYPLLASGIEISETVFITKSDVASAASVKEEEALIKEINPTANVSPVSLKTQLPDSLLATVL